jgi:arginase family enzyme
VSRDPHALVAGGLPAELEQAGAQVANLPPIRLSVKQERQYGAWERLALASGNMADTVASQIRGGRLVVGLLANCSSLLGMLGGVQHAGASGQAEKVGLVYIDMDVLDPAEVPGHSLNVKGGPTSAELADAVAEMFNDPKAVAIAVASTPTGERDAEGRSRKAAYALIQAAVRGIQARR